MPPRQYLSLEIVKKPTISQLSHPNEPRHILIEHLETSTVLFRLAGIAETTGAVEDFLEGIEVDCVNLKLATFSSPICVSWLYEGGELTIATDALF